MTIDNDLTNPEHLADTGVEIPRELQRLFEIDAIDSGEPASTVAGYSYLISKFYVMAHWGAEVPPEVVKPTAVSLALNRIKRVGEQLVQGKYGGNVLNSSRARLNAVTNFAIPRFAMINDAMEHGTGMVDDVFGPKGLEDNLMSMCITILGANKASLGAVVASYQQGDSEIRAVLDVIKHDLKDLPKQDAIGIYEMMRLMFHSYARIYKYAHLDLHPTKNDIKKLFMTVLDGKYDELIAASHMTGEEELGLVRDILIKDRKEQDLPFEILPAGTNLRELSEEIFNESTDSEKTYVDLERIQLLADIRELVGVDRCYFARGIRTGRTHAFGEGQRIDEDYILLVMQHHDELGQVEGEDVLAISPIARKHAAYLARHDTCEGLTWRDLFQLSKNDARELGVRRIKFVSATGENLMDTMQEKIFSLLTCSREDFEGELRRGLNGYKLVQRRSLGQRALSMQAAILESE